MNVLYRVSHTTLSFLLFVPWILVATNFSVSDILGPTGDKAIYRPMGDGAPDNIGHAVLCKPSAVRYTNLYPRMKGVKFIDLICGSLVPHVFFVSTGVRNSLQLDYGNGNTEYITYVDARLQLSVNTQSTASFGGNGELPPPQMGISVVMDPTSGPGGKTMIETTSKTVVVVESFLCGRSAINDGKPFQETYKIGQEFQICVRPAGVDPSAINIVDFKSIVCENSNHKRTILSNGVIDPLSDIIKNATWSKGLVEGQVTGDHGIAFRSVITSAFFAGSNTSSIQCKGEVSLGFASNANRQLVAAKFHGVQHRDLQNTREEAAPFATSVVLSRDRVFEIPTSNAVTITAHRKRTIISGMGIVIAMILAF